MYLYKLDEFKFYAAILVVIIHVTAVIQEQSLDTFLNYGIYVGFLNVAVPFFFTASGLFMGFKYKTTENFSKYIQKYALKISALYVSFTFFYLCFHYFFIVSDRLILKTPFWETSKYFFNGLTMGKFLNGAIGSYQLWFLTSLLLATLLILLLTHFKISPGVIFIISIIQYIFYSAGIITLNDVFNYGGVFKAFLYLSMGFYIAHRPNIEVSKPFLGFILSFLLYRLLRETGINELPMILTVFYISVYCIKYPGKPTKMSKLGQHSLNIYILHVFVLELTFKILIYLGYEEYYKWGLFYPITIILCVVLSIYSYPFISKIFYRRVEKWFLKFF